MWRDGDGGADLICATRLRRARKQATHITPSAVGPIVKADAAVDHTVVSGRRRRSGRRGLPGAMSAPTWPIWPILAHPGDPCWPVLAPYWPRVGHFLWPAAPKRHLARKVERAGLKAADSTAPGAPVDAGCEPHGVADGWATNLPARSGPMSTPGRRPGSEGQGVRRPRSGQGQARV